VPAELVGNPRLEPVARVMIALAEEAARRGAATLHAPYRLIGVLAGVPGAMTVMRRLGALGRLGYLSLVEPGIPGTGPTGKANTWEWHDPPRPGETVWNGASKPGAGAQARPAVAPETDLAGPDPVPEDADGRRDQEVGAAIDRAFGPLEDVPPAAASGEPDVDALLELIGRVEAAGFALGTWIQIVEHHDRKVKEHVRRLKVFDPDGRRRVPDRLLLPLMARARIIAGYLSRIESPSFSDSDTHAGRRAAMESSIADDRRFRLRLMGQEADAG
jgi:hypothetical protein